MKPFLAPVVFSLFFLPAHAQEPQVEKGFDLMQQGADLLLRGLMSQMEPAIKDLQDGLGEIEPQLKQLIEMMGDFRNYDAPQLQPNGDILIPHKTPPLPAMPTEKLENGSEIDL